MAIRHNSQLQSGYLFSAQYYLTNNYSVYSIKLCNLHKWQRCARAALKTEGGKKTKESAFFFFARRTCSGRSAAEVEKGQGGDGPVEMSLGLRDFIGGGIRSGGADARGNPGWKDTMFSLPKEKKCFYKVMWVYKEKAAACWQRNMDYSLDACQSPEKCPPSLLLFPLSLPSPQEAITQNTVD